MQCYSVGATEVGPFHLKQRSESSGIFLPLQRIWQEGLTQGMDFYRIFVVRCCSSMSCLNNRVFNSGNSCLMLQISKSQLSCLFFVYFKAIFCLLPFWIGVYKHVENKLKGIQYSPDCPSGSIPYLCISILSPDISNPHTSNLELRNPLRLDLDNIQHKTTGKGMSF